MKSKRILFVKLADRFLENEFVFQQLGPHYLQSYLAQQGIPSDLLILFEDESKRKERLSRENAVPDLFQLTMLIIECTGMVIEQPFNTSVFSDYNIIALSVMTPQAEDAYLLSTLLNQEFPNVTTVIGGSHARYYLNEVVNLPVETSFDFIVPQDGWKPILEIVTNPINLKEKAQVLSHKFTSLSEITTPPTRPIPLMERYNFEIAGVKAFHTITALGCPFSCNFCEASCENLRRFSYEMISKDLQEIAKCHMELGRSRYGVMFFDDVGLMNPDQVEKLSQLIKTNGFTTWRAFTHAYLVNKYKESILKPFHSTGGRRIGMGLETGSQKSLDLINKRNGKKQYVREHYEAVKIANKLGIAVDAFTMIFPWEEESDLEQTTKMIRFIAENPVAGLDEKGRPLKNSVDSTMMTPYQGTVFSKMIGLGEIKGVKLKNNLDYTSYFYKGLSGKSGWPYEETVLSKERYEKEQKLRNSMRPAYR